jgi:ABC-type sugar transport system permease subunit
MVIFLAGLQTIPRDLHEQAMVDGAGAWRRFRSITLPLLRPTLLFGAVLTGVGYLQFFEEASQSGRRARPRTAGETRWQAGVTVVGH